MPLFRFADKVKARQSEFLRIALCLFGLLAVTSCHRHSHAAPATPPSGATNRFLTPLSPPVATPRNAPDALHTPPPLTKEDIQLHQIVKLDAQGQTDQALDAVNTFLQANPNNASAYSIRGEIYSKKKQWDLAQKDYETILATDSSNVPAKFNLAELKFMQKSYDDARKGFAGIEADKDWGDLAAYRVYLCDLFGNHTSTAQTELDAFNKAGGNPSFYFANAAWHFFNSQPDEGQVWYIKGKRIYAPWKANLYASSLEELGYIPAAAPAPEPAK